MKSTKTTPLSSQSSLSFYNFYTKIVKTFLLFSANHLWYPKSFITKVHLIRAHTSQMMAEYRTKTKIALASVFRWVNINISANCLYFLNMPRILISSDNIIRNTLLITWNITSAKFKRKTNNEKIICYFMLNKSNWKFHKCFSSDTIYFAIIYLRRCNRLIQQHN